MKDLLVMKFGGTSVGSAERMRATAQISREQKQRRPVCIVVSAMSKVTDLLLDTMRHAEAGDRAGVDANIAKLRERHLETCRDLLPPERRAPVEESLEALIAEFERITGGMLLLNELPPRSVDEAVAIGERLSSLLIAELLKAEGTPAVAVNAAGVVVTDAVFGNASP
ncbi:MAG TPA: lysine-sensitive aspartokinase 3, partial [Edaphobacter sp.]|nr:lysine-sensitive aspartokinase 3 [Edaphobacter sp.]